MEVTFTLTVFEEARARATGPAIAEALAAAFPHPVSGTEIADAIWYARRAPAMPRRLEIIALAEALRHVHPQGARQPHMILRILHGAGLLLKFLDASEQVLWIHPVCGSNIDGILRRVAAYGLEHEKRTRRQESGSRGGRHAAALAAS